jgi:hypothetical protein
MPLSRISSPSIQNFSVEAQDFANNSIETYTSSAGRPLTNRNLIINGAMQIAQRNTSVTGITTTGYYTADRWQISISSAGTWTMNVDSSGPANTEFRNSANVICTTADSSLAAGDFFIFRQSLEGQNLQAIKKGTTAAESLTVSFYVKSSNTGTYICEFQDVDNTRQISKSYTISTANTWEKKTITVPPDTTGLLDNDNGNSLRLFFWLATGTDFTSGALNSSAWASNVNVNRAVGQLNLANASGNYWAVTGIQLETGTVATPFEMRNIGQELALCQRYYFKQQASTAFSFFHSGFNNTTTRQFGIFNFPQLMRSTPALEALAASNYQILHSGGLTSCSGLSLDGQTTNFSAFVIADVVSGLTTGQGSILRANNTTSSYLGYSAEL